MFHRILVPTDLLEHNKKALDIAVQLALHNNKAVTLLHVIEIIAGATFKECEDFYRKLEKKAMKTMDDFLAPYHQSTIEIEQQIVYGNRVREILSFAEARNIDLIVMDSHRIDLNNPVTGWGTISHKIGILAQCPVMLVK